MKIAIAQLNYHIGNFDQNFEKIKDSISNAKKGGADLVVFSELSVCGYPPRDFLEFEDFIIRCENLVKDVCEWSGKLDIACLLGSPVRNNTLHGKDLYNAAILLEDGQVKAISHKILLPTYDVFDENRYFEPGTRPSVVKVKGKRFALTVCEDLWNVGNDNPLYTFCPLDLLSPKDYDIILNISASPFTYEHAAERISVVRANALRYQKPILYCNQTGANTELIFDGGSLIINEEGVLIQELPYFEESVYIWETEHEQRHVSVMEMPKEKISLIHEALILGIRDYFQKLGFKQAILGLSGGIDSSVVAYLAAEALGSENVLGVLMPSEYSSEHSITDALALAENLQIRSKTIPISEPFASILKTLEPHFLGLPFNITEENLQSRTRAMILMALSNKFGYILLNTSNKSEAAVGYGTIYGDMCGGLSVIGDIYKTEVYELAAYINRQREMIPLHSIAKPPSAELRPGQKDSDSLPEYDILDKVLYQYIEKRVGPTELVAMGFDPTLISRILKMVNMSEFKRAQTPPVLRVSPKAFGMGRRLPIVGKYLS